MFDSPIQFEEADKAIAERLPADTALKYQDILRQWTPEARQRAFFSARVMDATVLSELKRRVQQVVSGDMTSEQATRLMQEFFRGEDPPLLQRMGFLPQDQGQGKGVSELASTARLRLIFETNTRLAQEVGHYKQWEAVKEAYPYGVWYCGYAEEHRPGHLARDGKAYPFDHSIWTQSPPGGEFNCHCWREPISAEEAAMRGLIPEPMDSAFQPSSLGFDPSRGMGQPVQPGRRTDPELAEKAKVPPSPEQLAPILPEPAAEPAPAPQETPEQHAAKRLAQWQAAFEKRRNAWEQSIIDAAPVAQDDPDRERKLQPYRQLAATLKEQYTPEAAKIGKPPRVVFRKTGMTGYDAKGMFAITSEVDDETNADLARKIARRMWHAPWEDDQTSFTAEDLRNMPVGEAVKHSVANQLIKEMTKEARRITSKIDNIELALKREHNARWMQRYDQIEKLRSEAEPLGRKIFEVLELPEGERARFTFFSIDDAFAPDDRKNLEAGSEMLSRFARRKDGEPYSMMVEKLENPDPSVKGGYSDLLDIVFARPRDVAADNITHELTHALENRDKHLRDRAIEFVMHRQRGRRQVRLCDCKGYGNVSPDIMTNQDEFDKAYSGRIYYDEDGKPKGSDCLTIGIQQLAYDPVRFLADDPEYFAFTVSALRGDL